MKHLTKAELKNPTCADVLTRALKILESGPLPKSHSEHGEWCPYCALALAKSQVDDEKGSGLTHRECLEELRSFTLRDSDMPLYEARMAVGMLAQPFTRSGTLEVLKVALSRHGPLTIPTKMIF